MKLFPSILVAVVFVGSVSGHGLVINPPGRNTIWREGFKNPANYDDMGLNCGGLTNQVANGGKCGVCGDPYQGPLKHESGYPGGYANGLIGRSYKQGDTVTFTAKITANHLGDIMYKLCPINDNSAKLTQDCFDRNPLSDVNGRHKISVSDALGRSAGLITTQMRLPAGLTCTQCVIQWTYKAGNNNGDETTPQEHFINCADVSITIEGGSQPKPTSTEPKSRTVGVTKDEESQKLVKGANDNNQQPPKETNNHQVVTEAWPDAPPRPVENQRANPTSENRRPGGSMINENNSRGRNRNQRNQRFMMNWK